MNNEVLTDYKKIWDEILKTLIKLIILRMFLKIIIKLE